MHIAIDHLILKTWHLFFISKNLIRREYKGLIAHVAALTCLGFICMRNQSSLDSLIFILRIIQRGFSSIFFYGMFVLEMKESLFQTKTRPRTTLWSVTIRAYFLMCKQWKNIYQNTHKGILFGQKNKLHFLTNCYKNFYFSFRCSYRPVKIQRYIHLYMHCTKENTQTSWFWHPHLWHNSYKWATICTW